MAFSMEMQEALVVWCEYNYNLKTLHIPFRIKMYLGEKKPVYYVPSKKANIPANYPVPGRALPGSAVSMAAVSGRTGDKHCLSPPGLAASASGNLAE